MKEKRFSWAKEIWDKVIKRNQLNFSWFWSFWYSSMMGHRRHQRQMNKNYVFGPLEKWYSQLLLNERLSNVLPNLSLKNTLMAVGCHGQHVLLASHCLTSSVVCAVNHLVFGVIQLPDPGIWIQENSCIYSRWHSHTHRSSDERYIQLVLPVPIFWTFSILLQLFGSIVW